MADNSSFIPGIFNYCDRWCERCTFTKRCRVWAAEREFRDDPASSDMDNAAFWNRLKSSLAETRELVMRLAAERDIDVAATLAEAESVPGRELEPGPEHQALVESAESYLDMVDDWFKASEDIFRRKGLELATIARLELPRAAPLEEANAIHEAVEVIRWYCHQICAKLHRASMHDPEEDENRLMADCAASDANGSAKVALVGLDRSMAAWGRLYESLPEAQDRILHILLHLDRLRRAAEHLFPDARAFIRPGFDEPR